MIPLQKKNQHQQRNSLLLKEADHIASLILYTCFSYIYLFYIYYCDEHLRLNRTRCYRYCANQQQRFGGRIHRRGAGQTAEE